LRCGTGAPVEPEVNTYAMIRAASICGTTNGASSARSPGAVSGYAKRGRSIAQSGASCRQNASGANDASWRTISGVCVDGSRLTLPATSAAHRLTAKR